MAKRCATASLSDIRKGRCDDDFAAGNLFYLFLNPFPACEAHVVKQPVLEICVAPRNGKQSTHQEHRDRRGHIS